MLEWPFAAAICRAAGQAPMSRFLQCPLSIALIERHRLDAMIACLLLCRLCSLHTCPACCIRCIDVHVAAKSLLHILQVIVSGTV